MSRQSKQSQIVTALEAFGLLLISILFIWMLLSDYTSQSIDPLVVVGVVCVALIARQIYDAVYLKQTVSETARTMADEIVSNSQELFTEIYRNSPIPYILLKDVHGTIESANYAAVRLFGKTTTQFSGQNLFDLFVFADGGEVTMLAAKLERGITIDGQELQIITSDGEKKWVKVSLFFYTQHSHERRCMVTFVDIEKEKRIDTAKSEFVSLASHQLRTPIAGMKWNAELLLLDHPEVLTENQRRYVKRLLKSVSQMDLMISDFLSVSRLELGTLVPEVGPHQLQQLVDDAFSEFTPQIISKNITIERDYDETIHTFETDGSLMRQVVGNLISNAVKYSRPNGTVVVAYVHLPENKLRLTISDQGFGIPKAELEHIFDKLYRASNVRQSVPDGTGLGLYIVKQAVRVLKGNIQVDSELGIGTTFTVTLPFAGTFRESGS